MPWVTIGATIAVMIANVVLATIAFFQIRTHREEIRIRFRAWVGRDGGKEIIREENTIILSICNHGALAARNITVRHHISEKDGWELGEPYGKPFDMTPSETVILQMPIPDDVIKRVNNGELYYGWRLEYYKDEKKKSKDRGVYELRGVFGPVKSGVLSVKAE